MTTSARPFVVRIAALAVVVFFAVRLQRRPRAPVAAPRDVRFELVQIDDLADPFADEPIPLPIGGSVQSELAPVGLSPSGAVRSSSAAARATDDRKATAANTAEAATIERECIERDLTRAVRAPQSTYRRPSSSGDSRRRSRFAQRFAQFV